MPHDAQTHDASKARAESRESDGPVLISLPPRLFVALQGIVNAHCEVYRCSCDEDTVWEFLRDIPAAGNRHHIHPDCRNKRP